MTIPNLRHASVLALGLALAACGSSSGETESADEFAARVNAGASGQPVPTAPAAPSDSGTTDPAPGPAQAPQTPARIAEPKPGAAPIQAPFEPGTLTDPKAAECGATKMATFLSQTYSEQLFNVISAQVPANSPVRIVRPDTAVTQDHRPNRLNVMLDRNDVIRDFRCG